MLLPPAVSDNTEFLLQEYFEYRPRPTESTMISQRRQHNRKLIRIAILFVMAQKCLIPRHRLEFIFEQHHSRIHLMIFIVVIPKEGLVEDLPSQTLYFEVAKPIFWLPQS